MSNLNTQPIDFFDNYTYSDNAIHIPIASLPVLSAEEAHATSGDGREVIRAIIEQAATAIDAMPANDRPKFMSISRGNIIGVSPGILRRSYVITFEEEVTPVATSLRPEPA